MAFSTLIFDVWLSTWNTGRTKSLFVFTHIYYHSYALNWWKFLNTSDLLNYIKNRIFMILGTLGSCFCFLFFVFLWRLFGWVCTLLRFKNATCLFGHDISWNKRLENHWKYFKIYSKGYILMSHLSQLLLKKMLINHTIRNKWRPFLLGECSIQIIVARNCIRWQLTLILYPRFLMLGLMF